MHASGPALFDQLWVKSKREKHVMYLRGRLSIVPNAYLAAGAAQMAAVKLFAMWKCDSLHIPGLLWKFDASATAVETTCSVARQVFTSYRGRSALRVLDASRRYTFCHCCNFEKLTGLLCADYGCATGRLLQNCVCSAKMGCFAVISAANC